ncbi:acyltransferase [Jeotgalibacillus sp. ET6]|uniref:acyltransferase n=1 Tax=Jeotgalibacillus sp. ET6 TaxID=3037260 RepID=UPI002418AFE7|nr:acyltransferase [Jeotgalibacillus sp. ET6]MDG5471574.1 acyltransferase [Jeotgalibacillus sp. ET6]
MRKERIESLKFMRVVAMNLVVLIHVTAVASTNVPVDHFLYDFYLMLNRFTRFEGSVFVFLSGLVLFYNYEDRPFTLKTWLSFYRKRFLFILGPYIFWSLFYEAFAYFMGIRPYEGVTAILQNLLNGTSYYQLYFIMILVQLFFFMPLFVFFIKKSAFMYKYLFIVGFVIELIYTQLNNHYDWISYPFFMVYIGSFFFGGWIGIHYQRVNDMLSKKALAALSILTIILGLLYTYDFFYRYTLQDPLLNYYVFQLVTPLYFLMACFLLFKIGIWVERSAHPSVLAVIERLRIYSFGFYLVHPFILVIWGRILEPETWLQFNLFIFIRLILVLGSTYLFIRALHLMFPKAWFLFGNLPDPKKQ